MDQITYNELKNNPKYYNYLMLNSNYLKILNRYGFLAYKKIIDQKYELTSYDKINKFVDRVSFINNIIESVK